MAGELSTRLPEELAQKIRGYSFTRHPYDETEAEIYVLSHQLKPRLYLKIRRGESNLLKTEYTILKWINQRVPTPEPLYYSMNTHAEYLLTTEIIGTPTYQLNASERETAVKIIAEALRLIHSMDTAGCPLDNSIENWLNRFIVEDKDLRLLEAWRLTKNLVFTHGDYCLPNIIVHDGVLSGIIDWDYAGLADPYVDFALCTWSIGYNFGVEESEKHWIPLFFKHYGLEEVDKKKIDFFSRLMHLGNN
jgi:aminoglycoside phosphotransferase